MMLLHLANNFGEELISIKLGIKELSYMSIAAVTQVLAAAFIVELIIIDNGFT